VLTKDDIQEICCVEDTKAGEIMRTIKARSDRLHVSTVVHIQDYLDAYKLPVDRYLMTKKIRPYEIESEEGINK
jgi:hypothetical protein